MKLSHVCILTNKYRTTFYVGVTNDLIRRILEHKNGIASKFTKKYNIKDLVYFEQYINIKEAIGREKQLKNWHKDWKISLIKEENPTLCTLHF